MSRINIILFASLVLIIFSKCSSLETKSDKDTNATLSTETDVKCNEIDTLYTDIKFHIYCIYSGVKFSYKIDSSTIIYYAECCLQLDNISSINDTLEFAIKFFYKNKPVNINDLVKNNNRNITRILYSKKEKKILQYITNWNLGIYEEDLHSRYFKPLQPDVIQFIQDNKEKLNSLFRSEAIRRGVIF